MYFVRIKSTIHTSGISETYIRGHNILELVDILSNVFFTTNETERDY